MGLEALAREHAPSSQNAGWVLPFDGQNWDYRPLLESILKGLNNKMSKPEIAWRFHAALAEGVGMAARALSRRHSFCTVALSGGVWQNRLLHRLAVERLSEAGFRVWWNQAVPPGDGGIALGQLALGVAG